MNGLEILACPVCKSKVVFLGEHLECQECGGFFRYESGIPIMLSSQISKDLAITIKSWITFIGR